MKYSETNISYFNDILGSSELSWSFIEYLSEQNFLVFLNIVHNTSSTLPVAMTR